MRRTFDSPVIVGVVLVVALLLLIPALTYRNTRQLNMDARWVAHSYEALQLTDDVLTVLVNAETGVRGFVITGNEEFLHPNEGLSRLDGLMAKLKDETKDNSDQQARVTKLEEMTAVRLGQFKETIDLRRKDEKAAQAFVITGKPKAQMDAIRLHVAEMEKVEHDLLKEREGKTATTYQIAVTSGLVTAVLGLLTVGAFVWLLNRSLSARQKAAAVIAEQAERLRTTLASIGDAVIATDLDGRVTNMNAVAEALTGWTTSEAMGQPLDAVFRIVNETTRKTVENPAFRALKEGIIVGLANHTVLIAKDGTERPIDDSAAPIRCKDGEMVGCVLVFRDITERHRQEAALRESQQFTRSVLYNVFAFVGVMTVDGTLTDANRSSLEAAGIPASEVLGKKFWDCYWWSYSPEIQAQLRDACERAAGGEVVRYDVLVRTAGDTRVWIDFQVTPLRDTEGRITHLIPSALEIATRRAAEEKLRLSEQRMRLATEATVVGIWEWNVFTGEVCWDAVMFQIYGIAPTTAGVVQYRDWTAAVLPEDLREQEEILQDAARRTGKSRREYRIRRQSDGECRHIEAVETVRTNDKGETEWVVGTNLDVTERKQSEAAMHTSEIRFRRLFEAAQDGVLLLDGQTGQITDANPYILEVLGSTRAEAIGRELWEIGVFADATASRAEMAELQNRGYVRYEDLPLVSKTGQRREVEVVANVYQENGHRVIQCNIRDITERKKMQVEVKRSADELRKLAADLSEADHHKDKFLAMLAHELRNPLAPIRNMLQVLKLKGDDKNAVANASAIIDRQVVQMVRMVDDLLDVSRVSRGRIELRRERVGLAYIIRQAEETASPMCESMNHELTVTLPSRPVEVDGDPARLIQVVSNLLTNACKFTDAGGRIWLSVERVGEGVAEQAVIRVRDNGVGISAENLPRLFQIFMQVDATFDRSTSGLGIGLALVKDIVKLHDGTVEVHSEGIRRGSEFVVRLPALPEEPQARPAAPALPNPADSATDQKPSLRILVVDDNRDSANSMAMLLKYDGHLTHTAYDGLQAVEAAVTFRPDVVLLDIGLPTLNGHEACRRIREQAAGQTIRLVAMTGWGQDEDRQKTAEVGFDAHLVKPVDYAALTKLLEEFLPDPV